MAIIFKKKAPAVVAPVAPPPPPTKTVIRVGPKPLPLPVKAAKGPEAPMTQRQQQKLVDAGLMEPEEKEWEPCPVGTRVTITNSMFPWVNHYKPGDKGLVTRISAINSSTEDKTGGHLNHIITIDQPLDKSRMNSRAMLFRWEFEPTKAAS